MIFREKWNILIIGMKVIVKIFRYSRKRNRLKFEEEILKNFLNLL